LPGFNGLLDWEPENGELTARLEKGWDGSGSSPEKERGSVPDWVSV